MPAAAGLTNRASAQTGEHVPRGLSEAEHALERDADRAADAVQAGRNAGPPLRRAATANSWTRPSDLRAAETMTAQHGAPLSLATRRYFEPRFGRDLSQVRVHTDTPAATQLSAVAFTAGTHIGFAPGQYRPATREGRHLIAHELAHVVQQTGATPLIQRRADAKEVEAASSTTIDAITAVQYAKDGEATLSTGEKVPIKLDENTLRPGDHTFYRISGTDYGSGESTEPGASGPRGFRWVNPWADKKHTKSRYAWKETVKVTITQTATQRIASLPPHIRDLFSSESPYAKAATDDEIERIAAAGDALAAANLTADEAALITQEMRRRQEQSGVAGVAAGDPLDWAQSYLAGRAATANARASNRTDLQGIARDLAENEPLEQTSHGLLGPLLDPSDKVELEFGIQIALSLKRKGRLDRLPGVNAEANILFLRNLVHDFQAQLQQFERAFLVDMRGHGTQALDGAEAAMLRLRQAYIGTNDRELSPFYFYEAIGQINDKPIIKRAAQLRDQGKTEIDRLDAADLDSIRDPIIHAVDPIGLLGYNKRHDERDTKKDKIDETFDKVVRDNSPLKLPPGSDIQGILGAKDPDHARTLLREYLYRGEDKIRHAREKLGSPKFIYSADIWIKDEQKALSDALGGTVGPEISLLIDRFAELRKSETSFWEDLLSFVQFIAMFVPGPIGWGLRGVTGAIKFGIDAGRIVDQHTLYGVGASSVDASSTEAFGALADLVFNLVPDVPGGAMEERAFKIPKGDAERVTKDAIEKETVSTVENVGADATKTGPHNGPAAEPGGAASETPPGSQHGGGEHGGGGGEHETGMNGDRIGVSRVREEVRAITVDDLYQQRDALARDHARLVHDLEKNSDEVYKLEQRAEEMDAKYPPKPGQPARSDEIRKNIATLEASAAEPGAAAAELSTKIDDLDAEIERLAPAPETPVGTPEAPKEPLGEFASEGKTNYKDTRMHSRNADVYIGTRQSGYRENVETLLLKDRDGPLSKALLENGKIVPYDATHEAAAAHRNMFVAGHAYGKAAAERYIADAAERDFIVLTSANRNIHFNTTIEMAGGERFSEYAYNIQGFAVEPGTAWELVEHHGLPASVVENAEKIYLVKNPAR
jgi:hypothetical protein